MTNKRYPWTRYWVPREGALVFDSHGFLLAPPEDTAERRFYRNDCISFTELAEKPCVILLGEPGIGKTTALEDALAQAQSPQLAVPVLSRHLGGYSSDQSVTENVFHSPEFRKWSESGGRLDVFLDSFDECLLRLDNLASLLKDQLMQLSRVDGLRLRITSRTAEWRVSLEEAFARKWKKDGDVCAYELAPLTETQVRAAAQANGLDDEAFIAEVIRQDVVGFAIKPLTLELLIRTWKKHGALPASQSEIYEQGCLELCAEPNPERTTPLLSPRFTAEQRLAIASQIAAGMVFSNRSAIWRGNLPSDKAETDLGEDEIVFGSVNVAGNELALSREGVSETLKSGLFTARGRDRLGWAHQTYVEFLAARWIRGQKLTFDQTSDLLFHPFDPDCRIVPQLHEVASWVASDQPDLFRHLSLHEPDILLRSDVSGVGADVKRDLVEGILRLSFSLPWSADWSGLRSRYRKLNHPGLSAQLREALVEYKGQSPPRQEIIHMLDACEIKELNADLLQLALTPDEDSRMRATAADFIGKRGTDSEKKGLLPLARSEEALKVTDDLKGISLSACWPQHMTAQDLFSHLTPEQGQSSSLYTIFLSSRLVPRLKVEDLPAALQWAESQPGPPHPPRATFSTLVYQIIHLAIQHTDHPGVLDSVAKTILMRLRAQEFCMDHETKPLFDFLESRPNIRLSIVNAMLPHVADAQDDVVFLCHWGFCWVRPDDLDWLLNRLSGETSNRTQEVIAGLVRGIFHFSDASKILEVIGQFPALRTAFSPWLNSVDTRSESAIQQKADFQRHQQLAAAAAVRRQRTPLSPSRDEHIAVLLAQAEGGDQSGWWKLCTWLGIDESGYEANAHSIDCQTKPGWTAATPETRARLVRVGHEYLLKSGPQEEEWLERANVFNLVAHGGLIALHLLAAEAPALFEDLSPEVWTRWCPAVLGFPTVGDAPKFQSLSKELLSKAPAVATEWSVRIVKIEDSTQGHISILGRLPHPLPADVGRRLVTEFESINLTVPCRRELLSGLVRESAPGVLPLLRGLIPDNPPVDDEARLFACHACRLLLLNAVPEDWSRIWRLMQSDETLGCTLVEGFRSEYDTRPGPLLKALNESELADFWKWMQKQYPSAQDEPLSNNGSVSLRWSMARMRDGIVTYLADMGTAAAVDQLQTLVNEYKDDVPWLGNLVAGAKEQFRRKAWSPPAPRLVFRLGQTAKSRFVENGAQLQKILIDALGEIQRRLTGEVPAAPDLWNSDRPKKEEEVSDWLKRQLDELLVARGVVLNREVRIHVYERTDVHVEAVSADPKAIANIKAIVEVKGCWHDEVKTAMETQLLNTYLVNNDCRQGIFLVFWFVCAAWSGNDRRKKRVAFASAAEMRQFLEEQAIALSRGGRELRAVVLDATRPSPKRTNKKAA